MNRLKKWLHSAALCSILHPKSPMSRGRKPVYRNCHWGLPSQPDGKTDCYSMSARKTRARKQRVFKSSLYKNNFFVSRKDNTANDEMAHAVWGRHLVEIPGLGSDEQYWRSADRPVWNCSTLIRPPNTHCICLGTSCSFVQHPPFPWGVVRWPKVTKFQILSRSQ